VIGAPALGAAQVPMIPQCRRKPEVSGTYRKRPPLGMSSGVVQRAVKDAVRAAGIPCPATCHSLRHFVRAPARSGLRHQDDQGAARPR
jgi:hypothetical protein